MSWTWQQDRWHTGYHRNDDWQQHGWQDEAFQQNSYHDDAAGQWSDDWRTYDSDRWWQESSSWRSDQEWQQHQQDDSWRQTDWRGNDWNSSGAWSYHDQRDDCWAQQSWGDRETETPGASEPMPSGSVRDEEGPTGSDGKTSEVSDVKPGRPREPKTGKEVIPSWSGDTPIRDYKKRIDLFLSTTAIDPEYRAGRLVEPLSGAAWRAVDTMDVSLLRDPQGVDHLLAHLRAELEPVEFLQTFGVLTSFYKGFKRNKGESFIEFDNRFRVQLQKLKEIDAELNDLSKAFWFLETASISDELRKQVVEIFSMSV